MKKKKQQKLTTAHNESQAIHVKDRLNDDLIQKLKGKQKRLTEKLEQERIAEIERKQREAKEKEKNKTFEELFSESNLSWKDFK
ncbi:YqkE family protein [Ectobacillus sp. JY-23]|uniref:YqkE family protein n=1 Tax=Ectobacillus sp. JY-23 TaxID=2933872 RepID=UPI001FF34F28|nr:YqkE family protein [Ectobacillus sp. JY-23]UOY93879.1 YqkE family protein [Ectobacillus sp. JY-23]